MLVNWLVNKKVVGDSVELFDASRANNPLDGIEFERGFKNGLDIANTSGVLIVYGLLFFVVFFLQEGTVATPIINKPEVAIVALGKLQKLPRFNDEGEVVARSIMQISWSGDHRVIDGGTIARFCNLWKDYLEHPTNMLAEMG